MFFEPDEDIDGLLAMHNPDMYRIVSRQLYTLEPHAYTRNRVPTHTEDGIPIRKLYVSNLPHKTTRTELFGVFAQYGFIKSCWLRLEEKGPNKSPIPTYAFVTFSNPDDAHKALEAPAHEKMLRGRNLRISPADSWHQPAQEADGSVRWRPRSQRDSPIVPHSEPGTASTESTMEEEDATPGTSNSDNVGPDGSEQPDVPEADESYSVFDILNKDCITYILSRVPIVDLIRSERVSKRWQTMVEEYLGSIRTFKTTWWGASPGSLTTAVLRRVLSRAGASLVRLHIDNLWCALNDRTAHTVGKFCPNLEELKVVGMHTKNWNPLIYGCKQLKSVSFISCNKLTDMSLVQIVKEDSSIESLTVANNTHITGLFLTDSNPVKLHSLSFYNCYSLQGSVLGGHVHTIEHLTTLKLDCCPNSLWKVIPFILGKLPWLQELSLSEYMSTDLCHLDLNFAKSIANLPKLRVLNLFKNIYVTDTVLKQVAETCTNLQSLDISCCNSRNSSSGVTDEGVTAVCTSCQALTRLDVSYLGGVSDAGLRALPRLTYLTTLVSRGNPAVSAIPFANALAHCHLLQEVDLCGCDCVSEEVAEAGRRALEVYPRALTLRLAATAAVSALKELPTHKLLTVNTEDDRSNPNLRPDFVDDSFEDSSDDDSFDDMYEHEEFEHFMRGGNMYCNSDEEFYMEDEDYDLEGLFAYGHGGPEIILINRD